MKTEKDLQALMNSIIENIQIKALEDIWGEWEDHLND